MPMLTAGARHRSGYQLAAEAGTIAIHGNSVALRRQATTGKQLEAILMSQAGFFGADSGAAALALADWQVPGRAPIASRRAKLKARAAGHGQRDSGCANSGPGPAGARRPRGRHRCPARASGAVGRRADGCSQHGHFLERLCAICGQRVEHGRHSELEPSLAGPSWGSTGAQLGSQIHGQEARFGQEEP